MPANTLEAVLVLLIFFSPGYITLSTVARFFPRKQVADIGMFMKALTYSVINYGILLVVWPGWVPRAITISKDWRSAAIGFWWDGFFLFIAILVLPFLIGIFIVLQNKSKGAEIVRNKIGISSIDLIPTAWDYYFNKSDDCWVLIHTKQGDSYLGIFAKESFASSFESGPDLYLEELWTYNGEEETFETDERSKGGYFKYDDIEHLEFYEP